MSGKTFKIVLIKPSHYDDDGYVIQWYRSLVPSNSLASINGVFTECASARVLGPDVDIKIVALDETNMVVDFQRISREIHAADGGFVGLVGVQSNQFPRALDLTRKFRALKIPVVIGGFHVSGCLAMLDELPADLQQAISLGASLFAGEAEGRAQELLLDLYQGDTKPIYNFLADTPNLSGAELPVLPAATVNRVVTDFTSFDAGRGCPFQCSFCTIINVQGRKSRYRTADDVENIMRLNAAQGIKNFFVTDDNFARNKNWESIIDRIIHLREREGFSPSFIFQVDTLCHRIPRFVEKLARAGCISVFIGLENINPQSLKTSKKRQNKISEYRDMLLAWRNVGVTTCAGYILGFPTDTPKSVAADIATIQKELPIDILEFFILTPLPGSEDHKTLHLRNTPMEPDMNSYDLEHVCAGHPLMSRETLAQVYADAWRQYYSDAHIETILRRAIASRMKSERKLCDDLVIFSGAVRIEGVHPLQFGVFRRKTRLQRRSGLPLENPILFHAKRAAEVTRTAIAWISLYMKIRRTLKKIRADMTTSTYTDDALRSVDGPSSFFVAGAGELLIEQRSSSLAVGK